MAAALLFASMLDPAWLGSPGTAAADRSWLFHLVGYAALGVAVRPVFGPGWTRTVAAVAVATGFGAGVEFVQLGLPYRTASLADGTLNGVGAAAGVAARAAIRQFSSARPADDP